MDGFRNYDQWKTASPWDNEYPRRCVCGHPEEDHSNPENMDDDPPAMLDALKRIDAFAGKQGSVPQIVKILDEALTVCGVRDCTCRKFEPQHEDDTDYLED